MIGLQGLYLEMICHIQPLILKRWVWSLPPTVFLNQHQKWLHCPMVLLPLPIFQHMLRLMVSGDYPKNPRMDSHLVYDPNTDNLEIKEFR